MVILLVLIYRRKAGFYAFTGAYAAGTYDSLVLGLPLME
jgi:hypothetical protein